MAFGVCGFEVLELSAFFGVAVWRSREGWMAGSMCRVWLPMLKPSEAHRDSDNTGCWP